MIAITSATGCSTMSEPAYPRLGATNTPLHQNLHAPAIDNQPLHDSLQAVLNEPEEAPIDPKVLPAPSAQSNPLIDQLYQHYKEWRGTRYKLGGLNKGGVDCSGFVYLTFLDQLGIELPRSTYYQVQKGRDVARDKLQTGDLVFFRNGRTNHVGIYLEDGKFMHSSTRSGVRISSLGNTYWKRSYWKARRLNLPADQHIAQNP